MSLIKCENVSLGYEGRTVISHLNFTVEQGDYLFILGENGSGKSTLTRAILGQKNVISGTVEFGDGLKQNEIGYLPQQTPVQKDFPASVKEIVLSGCLNTSGFHPFYSSKQKEKAKNNMEKLGIIDLADCCYRELSGGQQQRVLLARALCAAGRLLILDEPAAGLDPRITGDLYHLIRHINEDGMTVIMVSHDIAAAEKYASHILHVGSAPLFFGTKEEYLSSEVYRIFGGGVK